MIKSLAGVAATSLLMLSTPAAAAVVLDQASVPESGKAFATGAGGSVPSPRGIGQSFTVGKAGVLDHIDIGLFNSFGPAADGFEFQLRRNDGATIFSRSYTPAGVPDLSLVTTDWSDLFTVDLAAAQIGVTPGEVLKWLVTSTGAFPNYQLIFQVNNSVINYGGGQGLSFGFTPQGTPFQPAMDYAFRTYVATVPEPGAWALMMLGFGLGGTALRVRRRSVPA